MKNKFYFFNMKNLRNIKNEDKKVLSYFYNYYIIPHQLKFLYLYQNKRKNSNKNKINKINEIKNIFF
jgi:hypothetical protein